VALSNTKYAQLANKDFIAVLTVREWIGKRDIIKSAKFFKRI